MNRRSFVGTLAAGVVSKRFTLRFPTRLSRVGLELYSVRDAMKADPDATLAQVRAMGYNDVEILWSFDNFGRTPQQVKAALDKEGLRAPSGHIAPEKLLTNWQKSIDDARLVGSEYLIVPSLPDETHLSLDGWKQWADRFNNAGQIANKSGLWLAFHNEPEHMKQVGGKVPLDHFLDNTDPSVVRFQLDVGNMLIGGGDPMKYLTKYRERCWSFHLKDVTADHKHDTEMGTGVFDFKKFLAAIPNIDRKPCYVEQESPKDPMASAARNYKYVSTFDF
jgi:sugar phosphate isomerase/epimerase